MTATTKRIIDKAWRELHIQLAISEYLRASIEVEASMPTSHSDISWDHIHACRKALTAATVALDAIETQMPSENRRGR